MTPDDLAIPSAVRRELDHLLITINRATTSGDAERAGLLAKGFVLGIEVLRALNPASIEALYLVVERTMEGRKAVLHQLECSPLPLPHRH